MTVPHQIHAECFYEEVLETVNDKPGKSPCRHEACVLAGKIFKVQTF
jgi:hypothetical protein